MPYRVYQDGKRCADYHIPTWDTDTFDTFEEAVAFAHHWCNVPSGYGNFELPGQEIDMSWCEIPVMMKIEHVE